MNILLIVTLLSLGCSVLSSKDIHSGHQAKKWLRLKVPQEDLKKFFHIKSHAKGLKTRDSPQTCKIICPIILLGNCGDNNVYPDVNANSTATSFESGETHTSSNPAKQTTSKKSKETRIKKVHGNIHHKHEKRSAKASKKSLRKKMVPFNRLTKVQQRYLLKKLKLANRQGRKAYKFRKISPLLCGIECGDETEQPNAVDLQQGSPDSTESEGDDGDDDSDDDSYQEGEDTPIEATIKPYVPEDNLVGGVKPFGLVDFMGFDDFGPNGELAKDPDQFYEEF